MVVQGLDHAVGRDGHDLESSSRLTNRLVVIAIHRTQSALRTMKPGECRAPTNVMSERIVRRIHMVFDIARMPAGKHHNVPRSAALMN